MIDRKREIRDYLAATRATLMETIGELAPEQWETHVQSDEGTWTARNVLAHLAVSETAQLNVLSGIAAGGPGVPETLDLHRWNNSQVQKRQEKTVAELTAAMKESRHALLAKLDTLADEQLDYVGRHASGKMLSVEQFFLIIGEHEALHAQDIARARSVLQQGG